MKMENVASILGKKPSMRALMWFLVQEGGCRVMSVF